MEENKISIKINFYGELIEHTINSDYSFFLKDICKIFNLSENQLNSIAINYKDEDGDIIILSNKDDFELFLEQVKNKEVDTLIIEINENSNIKEQKEKEIDNINHNNKNNINEKNINIFYDNFNNKENDIHIQNVNNDAPLILYFECNSCYISPIINCMYYCKDCNICYCEECKIKYSKHPHPFEKIETEEQFEKFKKEYNDKIKLKQYNNGNINNNNNIIDNNIDNNNNNNINNNNNNNIDYNRINIRNQDQNYNDNNNNNINHINQYYHDNNYNHNQNNDFYNNNNNYNHHNQYNDIYNNNNNYNQHNQNNDFYNNYNNDNYNHNQYNDFYNNNNNNYNHHHQNHRNQYNDFYNNYNHNQYNDFYNNNNYNPNQNNIFNQNSGFPAQISSMVNQIENSIRQFGSEVQNTNLFKNIKYTPKIFEMRRKYGLMNISNERLYYALNRANGNIEEALGFLFQQ